MLTFLIALCMGMAVTLAILCLRDYRVTFTCDCTGRCTSHYVDPECTLHRVVEGENVFAHVMDGLVRPFVWLSSPAYRAHLRYVRAQDIHLDRHVGARCNTACAFCNGTVNYPHV